MASEELHEVVFASTDISATLLPEAGARLHRLRVFGHDLLRTPDDPREHLRMPFFWGGYHMLPWANRIAPGPTRVGSRSVDLRPSFKDGTAIHGLHYVTPWSAAGDGAYEASGGGDTSGWPWPYSVRVEVSVEAATLRLRHSVSNRADDRMPAGAGIHPWFREPVEVRIQADLAIASNTNPDAPHEPARGELDMSEFGQLAVGLDAAWTECGQPIFELRWPDLGISARMRAHAPAVYVVAANPGHLGSIAMEPQTHAPWGLRRLLDGEPGGLTWIDPGATLTLTSELEFRRAQEDLR